jgi:hypothetical protein
MALNALLRMLVAHFVVSAALYGKSIQGAGALTLARARRVLVVSAVYAVLLYAALGLWNAVWVVPGLLAVFAAACFSAAALRAGWARLLVFTVLPPAAGVLLWMRACGTIPQWLGEELLYRLTSLWSSERFLLVLLGFVVLIWPAGHVIGLLTEPFRRQLGGEVSEGLARAGLWIGCIERVIIYIFVLSNAVTAIAFLVTAKSIFRFGEVGKPGKRKEAEYILIGTLLSFATAMVVGYVVRYSMSL